MGLNNQLSYSYTLQLYDTNYLDLVNSIGYINQPSLSVFKKVHKLLQLQYSTLFFEVCYYKLHLRCLSPSCPYTMILQQTRLLGIREKKEKEKEASYSFTRRLTMGVESASVPSSVSTPYPARPPNNFTTTNQTQTIPTNTPLTGASRGLLSNPGLLGKCKLGQIDDWT